MEQNLQLETAQQSHSRPTSSKNDLINEWLTRFALNASVALDTKTRALYASTWAEGFADIEPGRLKAAFIACLRSHTFKTMPTIGDVRQHLSKAEESAANLEAEQKWQQVLTYAQSTSPDYPTRPIKIKDQTQAALRAAGGLNWIRDCPKDDLQWAKKRFVEAFTSWNALEKNQFLLPDGEVKTLIAGAAQKFLPGAKP